jgi:hypothetical protein
VDEEFLLESEEPGESKLQKAVSKSFLSVALANLILTKDAISITISTVLSSMSAMTCTGGRWFLIVVEAIVSLVWLALTVSSVSPTLFMELIARRSNIFDFFFRFIVCTGNVPR